MIHNDSWVSIGNGEVIFCLIYLRLILPYAWQTSDAIYLARRLSKRKPSLASHLHAKRSWDETCEYYGKLKLSSNRILSKWSKLTCWQRNKIGLTSLFHWLTPEFLILAVSMKGMPLLSVHTITIWRQGMGEAPVQQTKWGLVRFLSCCDFAGTDSQKPSIYKLRYPPGN